MGCTSCGFGFLFELLEDYFPRPGAGIIVCGDDLRVLALGRGVFELTGYQERDLLGKELTEGIGLSGFNGANPVTTAAKWGVRQLDQPLTVRTKSGSSRAVMVDIFPAYDDDGGLLVALAPR